MCVGGVIGTTPWTPPPAPVGFSVVIEETGLLGVHPKCLQVEGGPGGVDRVAFLPLLKVLPGGGQ